MTLRAKVFERTAVYKARVQSANRIVIPDIEMELLGMSPGDNIRVSMYRVTDTRVLSRDKISFLATVQQGSRFTVPKDERKVYDIGHGDAFQVIVRPIDSN
jgi:bifunctional DNA-binding transcriptional regulator/antitoxin component of YhaV-PrlF toxin-antitoxin module